MDIHKPKPVRSWRELLTEVGVIVLSVCIALAAEQAVEWWHWRNQVAEAQVLVTRELSENLSLAIFRVNTTACIEQRVEGLAAILDKAAESGRLPPVGVFGTIYTGIWPNAAWNTVMASQAAAHFSTELMGRLSRVYRLVDSGQEARRGEIEAWMDLYPMVGPGRRLDPASEAALRTALSRVRSYNRVISVIGMRLMQEVPELGLSFPEDVVHRIEAEQKRGAAPLLGRPKCLDLAGEVPAHYGQGIINSALPELAKARFTPLKLKLDSK